MSEPLLIGYAVTAVVILGGFIAVVQKFTQPINDLKVVMQRLIDTMDNLEKANDAQNKRLDKHGEEIDELRGEVKTIKAKMSLYHKE